MKKPATFLLLAVLQGSALTSLAVPSDSSSNGNDTTTAKEVRRKVSDAAVAVKDFSVDKRDEAASKAKASLDDLDARIKTMEARIERDWDKMDKAARAQARDTLAALRKERVQVAEWYGALKNSTASTWHQVKKGFSDAYQSLRKSWEKADRKYGEEDGK